MATSPDERPIEPSVARRWKSFERGPRDQWLRCEGSALARLAACVHFAWPSSRGQWRLNHLLRLLPGGSLRSVPFRSSCGVPIVLDIPGGDFLYLSGRLSSEPLELAIVARLVRPGDVFVDVGAHRGLYILHVLGRLGKLGRYIAVEPSPSSLRFLARAFPADPRLEVHAFAASDTAGTAGLAQEGSVFGHLSSTDAAHVVVRTARLDEMEIARPHDAELVVKIDAEGHEAHVIRGCARWAHRGIRPIFVAEFIAGIHGQGRRQILDAIEESFGSGYRYFAIDPARGALHEFVADELPEETVRNIVAMPSGKTARLAGCVAGGAP